MSSVPSVEHAITAQHMCVCLSMWVTQRLVHRQRQRDRLLFFHSKTGRTSVARRAVDEQRAVSGARHRLAAGALCTRERGGLDAAHAGG